MNDYIKKGFLEVYCGPMKSGKSKYLLTRLDKFSYIKNINIEIFKPSIDTRNNGLNSRFLKTNFDCIYINQNKPKEILEKIKKETNVIIIDEIQFFSKEIYNVLKDLIKLEKHIIVAGLDLDFRAEPFGEIGSILAIANRVIKLKGVCEFPNCNKAATRSQRLINGEPAKYDDPIILIGDDKEGYECRCYKHHEI